MFDLELEWTVGVGGGGRARIFTPTPPPFFLFLTIDGPIAQILSLPKPSAAIKIKDGGYNFRLENTEHLLAKIKAVLQVTLFTNLHTCGVRHHVTCIRTFSNRPSIMRKKNCRKFGYAQHVIYLLI